MPIRDVSDRSLEQLSSLEGRVAVITGGGRGIGLAIARRFAEAGAVIAIGDLDEAAAARASDSLAPTTMAIGREVDVTSDASVAALADHVESELGPIAIWVNNAGIFPQHTVLEMSTEEWDHVLGVNLRGTFLGSREAASRMATRPADGGVIINIASVAAYRSAGPGISHYVTSKHGVLGLTRALAVELGPANIRVLAIAPTRTDTPGMAQGKRQAVPQAVINRDLDLPLGRTAVADDVARVALFCASDLSIMVTGSTIAVDGGALAQ